MNLKIIPKFKISIIYIRYIMGNSCSSDLKKAKNDIDTAKDEINKYKQKYNDTTTKLNTTTTNLINTTNLLNEKINKLNETKIKLQATEDTLKQTQYKLDQTFKAYNTQSDEMGYLTNRVNVSEYFSVKEGLSQAESDELTSELRNIDRNSYNNVLDQNKQLENEIEKYRNEYSTDEQKVNYEQQNIYFLLNAIYVLKWLYFFLFFIVAYFLYYTKNYSIYFKSILLIIIAIYPFVIYTIEKQTYDFFKFLWSFVHP